MRTYVVIAYRWNNDENHSYLVGAVPDKKTAIDIAEKEADDRGGKYGVRVYECNYSIYKYPKTKNSLIHTAYR